MPRKYDYTKDIEPFHKQAEEIVHLFKLEKDGFADAFKDERWEDMNEHCEQIIQYIKEFARLFYYARKWKSSMDLVKNKDFRKDRRVSEVAMSISRQAEYLRKDRKELNLRSFREHADQAEKKMYLMFTRLEQIMQYGISVSPTKKSQVSRSHLISENLNKWKEYIENEVKPKKDEDNIDPIDKIDQLFNLDA